MNQDTGIGTYIESYWITRDNFNTFNDRDANLELVFGCLSSTCCVICPIDFYA